MRRIRRTTIRQKATYRILQRLGIVLGTGVMLVAANILSFPQYRRTRDRLLSFSLSIFIYVIVIWASKLIPLVLDRTWVGTVEKREIKQGWHVPKGFLVFFWGRVNIYRTLYCTFKVSDGKREHDFRNEIDVVPEGYFAIGERVRHYKGAKFLAPERLRPANMICPWCGQMMINLRCLDCGTVLEPDDE